MLGRHRGGPIGRTIIDYDTLVIGKGGLPQMVETLAEIRSEL